MPTPTTSTTTTTATHSSGGAYASSLRDLAREELAQENWAKYSALALLNSVKALAVRGKEQEMEGDVRGAYVTYFKASTIFNLVINHRDYQKAQREPGKEQNPLLQAIKAYDKEFSSTVLQPAIRLSERLKAIELQKQEKAERRDTPILPGTPLPFTLPVSPPSSSPSFPSTPDQNPQPLSPGSQPAPRSIADRVSMLRQHGFQDSTISDHASHASHPSTSGPGGGGMVNGKRFSREVGKPASPISPSPSLPNQSQNHTGSSGGSRVSDIPALLPSAPIQPSPGRSRPGSAQLPSPLPSTSEEAQERENEPEREREREREKEATRRPPHIQTESEFDASFPTLSALEAQFPDLPSVPSELPGLPPVPSHKPSDSLSSLSGLQGSASSRPARPESARALQKGPPPPVPPKPISPHLTGSAHGRPPSVSSIKSHPSGGGGAPRQNFQTSISPRELYNTLQSDSQAVLILDIRDQSDYLSLRIALPPNSRSSRVQLEPTLIDRPSLTSSAIESALSLNPPEEAAAFSLRASYDLLVLVDEKSQNLAQSERMRRLVGVIWENEFAENKKLDRPPIVLVGGVRAWRAELGEEGLEGSTVTKRTGANGAVLNGFGSAGASAGAGAGGRGRQEPHRERVETLREERGRSSLDQLPNRIWTPPQASSPTEDKAGLSRKPAISRSPATTRLHNMYRDGESSLNSPTHSPIGYTPSYQSFYNNPSGAASVGGLYRSMPSVPEGTQLPTPPAASAPPPTSMSRRRSDYAELSQYSYSGAPAIPSSRPSIDYPQLNVNAAPIITPPPAAASSSMERQDSRPIQQPRPLAQYLPDYQPPTSLSPQPPQSQALTKPTTNGYLGNKSLIPAPRIQSDWPVTYWPDVAISASGLKNLGNTCYMNAPLQCLSATVPFARFFLENRWQKAVNTVNPLGTHGQLAGAFAKMVQEMWQAQYTYLSPVNFRRSVCQYARQFAGADQHDAQEFISFLLDGLHEDLNRILRKPPNDPPTPEREAELETLPQQIAAEQEWQRYQMRDDSIVVDYFQGQFRNRLQCLTCGKTSTTYNSFMYLSLPIPSGRGINKVTLQQCLDAFVKDEIMEKEDAWMCPHCQVLRKATKRLSISRLPPVLLIHLKRFSFKGPFVDKLETLVEFPLRDLDLTNYMPPPLPPGADKGLMPPTPVRLDDPRAQIPPYRYDLYAVTNHFGSLSSGHYTAFIASKGSWVYCDDSRLSNAEGREIVAKPAYILFYKRVPR